MTLNELMNVSGKASEAVLNDTTPPEEQAALLDAMRGRLGEMRGSIVRGLASDAPSRTGMVAQTPNPKPQTPNPKPQTPNPKPLRPAL